MKRFYSITALACGAVMVASVQQGSSAQTAAANGGINVVVNQVPLSFAGEPPREVGGSVLVPLRGVFEKLGASVDYNPASQQIQSRKGATLVVLTVGQTTAFVNGSPQTLNQAPVEIDGTTLIPLRFVAQSFGADVAWLPTTETVEINTVDRHIAGLPAPPLNSDGVAVGTLTGIYNNTDPQTITLRVNGDNTSVPITRNTVFLLQRGDQAARQSSIADLQIGEQIRVTESSQGAPASLVRVTYGEIAGTLKSIAGLPDGTSVVTLNDGQSRQVAQDARIVMAGRPVHLSDILPDEYVVLRIDPDTKVAYYVSVPANGGRHDDGFGASQATGGGPSAAMPHPPIITAPLPGASLGGSVVVSGRAAPNAAIKVTVEYRTRAIGGLIAGHGTAAEATVTADDRGRWSTDPLTLDTGGGLIPASNTTYILTATATDTYGRMSSPTVVDLGSE